MKVCMVNSEYHGKVKNSENGHIYLKALRERVLDELEILKETDPEDLTFSSKQKSSAEHLAYDVESAYNMQSVNNAHALGYDHLQDRGAAQTPTELFDAAH